MLDDRLDFLVEILRAFDLSPENVLVNDHRILVREGVDTCIHLINEDTQSPPIHTLPMSLVQQDLGRQVFRRPTKGVGACLYLLSKAEISELEVAIFSNQQIFRLEVSKNDALVMQVFEDQYNLSRV